MMVTCWSVKGGSGTTVVAACLALTAARVRDRATLLVDSVGDVPAVLGVDEPAGPGLFDWPIPAVEASREPIRGTRRIATSGAAVEIRVDDRLSLLPRGPSPFVGVGDPAIERLVACLAADGRFVVVDAGTIDPGEPDDSATGLVTRADRSLLVVRPCYLALRRASRTDLPVDGVVLVSEPGRSLDARDVASVVGAPVVAQIRVEPQIARLVDAGLLCSRLPRSVDRALGGVVEEAS